MLKAGLIGAGHLGKIHLKLLQQSSKYELIGFHDANASYAQTLADETGHVFFETIDDLLEAVDVVDIVTPTLSHFSIAKKAIEAGKHVFIEKPVTHTVEEAEELIRLVKENGTKAQVGHVERFNPAFLAAQESIEQPMFIESHRLAQFNPRGTDVPVVLDLMIHDLDIILSVVKSRVKEIRSSGVKIISQTPDIANARLVFENGCVANISTSRISMKNMRKCRFFQENAYVSVDFLEKKSEIIRMETTEEEDTDKGMILTNAENEKRHIWFDYPEVLANNAILDELNSFANAIENDTKVAVSLEEAKQALDLALQIIAHFEA